LSPKAACGRARFCQDMATRFRLAAPLPDILCNRIHCPQMHNSNASSRHETRGEQQPSSREAFAVCAADPSTESLISPSGHSRGTFPRAIHFPIVVLPAAHCGRATAAMLSCTACPIGLRTQRHRVPWPRNPCDRSSSYRVASKPHRTSKN
jgi:hypothetical protein